MPEKINSEDRQDETKIPTDPLPPPAENLDQPISTRSQIMQIFVTNPYVAEFDGDPSNAVEIVKIIPEKQAYSTMANASETHMDPHADTDPPPASSEEFDTNIFSNLRQLSFDTASIPPDALEIEAYEPLFSDRPPKDKVFADIIDFRLNPRKKTEK